MCRLERSVHDCESNSPGNSNGQRGGNHHVRAAEDWWCWRHQTIAEYIKIKSVSIEYVLYMSDYTVKCVPYMNNTQSYVTFSTNYWPGSQSRMHLIWVGCYGFLVFPGFDSLTHTTCTFTLIWCTWPKGSYGLTDIKPWWDKSVLLFCQPSEAYWSRGTYIFSIAVRLCWTWIGMFGAGRSENDRDSVKG